MSIVAGVFGQNTDEFLPGIKLAMERAMQTSNSPRVTEYDEGLVRQLIEKITVYDDHLAFEFKSGLETEVQM